MKRFFKKIVSTVLACAVAAGMTQGMVFAEDSTVYNEEDLRTAIAGASAGDTITLDNDIKLTQAVVISTGIIIDGGGNTITANFSSTANVFTITASDVSIKNLTIDGAETAKHAINVYKSQNVTVTDVTMKNMVGLGLLVNASEVTAAGTLTFANNGWGNNVNVGWGQNITGVSQCVFDASDATLVGVDAIYADKGDVERATAVGATISITAPEGYAQDETQTEGIYYVLAGESEEPETPPYIPPVPDSSTGDDDDKTDTDVPGDDSASTEPAGPANPEDMPENGFGVDTNGDTFFYEDGELQTGWVEQDGTWYYMDEETGAMNTEDWVQVNGTWYNFSEDGKMATGWQQVDGVWYYMQDWGGMTTGWQQVNGSWYYMYSWGGMATGWVYDNGTWYYMQSWGGMATGWQQVGGKWYYLYSNGAMAANTTIDGYVLGADGAMK